MRRVYARSGRRTSLTLGRSRTTLAARIMEKDDRLGFRIDI